MHHFRMKLFPLIPCNKTDVSNFWCCCYHFTDSSHFSGSFTCAKIYENIPDASLPEKMSLQVSDGNGAEAVVFFKIQKTNNHPPQIEPYQFQLIPIIGYPNFIWMDYPVQIPILRMKWSDWDSMDNISVRYVHKTYTCINLLVLFILSQNLNLKHRRRIKWKFILD